MKKYLLITILVFSAISCKKTFLDPKPNDSLVVPTTLKDLQALLDNEEYMNGYRSLGPNPGLLFAGTDEYYLPDDRYNKTAFQYVRNAFIWKTKNLYEGQKAVNDWASPYRTVYYANIVLTGLQNVATTVSNTKDYNNAKGSALFYRAYAFYQLSQVFAQPYNPTTAKTDLGIPLRLDPDINAKSTRASVEQTYDQILSDLNAALPLLPQTPLFNTRPSKAAVYALMARMNLGMENYDKALVNADSSLNLHPALLNYSTLSATASFPMPATIQNPEVIFSGTVIIDPLGSQLVNLNYAIIDSTIYSSFKDGDLRKTVCFKTGTLPGSHQFKGSYTKTTLPFAALATDEMYFIKAECLARKSDIQGAMDALNTLLKSRWKSSAFVPLTAISPDDALMKVLIERKKGLLMRGTRWTDLKRLNKDSRFTLTINRFVNGQGYSLPSGDLRYTWPIPDDVLNFNPGMPQNPY